MKKNIKLLFLIIFIWIALSTFSVVNAASANIEAKPATVTVGETVNVTVTVEAAAWNLKVSGSAVGKIIGYNGEGQNEIITKTYPIDTSKAGTYIVSLTGDITDQSKNTPDDISKSVTITVKEKETKPVEPEQPSTPSTQPEQPTTPSTPEPPKEKSNNAYLATLGVRIKSDLAQELGVETNAYDFTGFSKTKTTYNVTIPSNVDYLKVEYRAADSNAKVNVTGNSGFEVGSNNKITIKVTAEDGKTTQTYVIKVTQLAEEEKKPGNIIEDDEGLYLKSLSLNGTSISPEFVKDTYAYTATLSDSSIAEIEVLAEANKENAKIEISGNTNLVVGENTINIIVKLEDSSIQTIYQIVLTKEEAVIENTIVEEENNNGSLIDNIISNIGNYVTIFVIIVIIIICAIIILVVLLRKEEKEVNNEEYNVYKDDNIAEEKTKEQTNETETKNERVKSRRRREKGRHSK